MFLFNEEGLSEMNGGCEFAESAIRVSDSQWNREAPKLKIILYP